MPNLIPIADIDDDSSSAVVPAGPLAIAVDALRTLVANVPYFQTWTGSANAAAALLRVFTGDSGYPLSTVAIASNVVTFTTREPHGLQVGMVVTIEGASLGAESSIDLDGPQTVLSISQDTFTISTTLADQPTTSVEDGFVFPAVRPIAIICESEQDPLSSKVIGTGGASVCAGSIDILVEADVSVVHQHNAFNALYEARNALGQFHQGIAETQGTADLMCLNSVDPVSGPEFTNKPEQDDSYPRFERWRAVLRVRWGLEG